MDSEQFTSFIGTIGTALVAKSFVDGVGNLASFVMNWKMMSSLSGLGTGLGAGAGATAGATAAGATGTSAFISTMATFATTMSEVVAGIAVFTAFLYGYVKVASKIYDKCMEWADSEYAKEYGVTIDEAAAGLSGATYSEE